MGCPFVNICSTSETSELLAKQRKNVREEEGGRCYSVRGGRGIREEEKDEARRLLLFARKLRANFSCQPSNLKELCVLVGIRRLTSTTWKKRRRKNLLKIISLAQFPGIQGHGIGDVKFNKDGDRIGRYSIYQYQQQPPGSLKYTYVQVGEFGEFPSFKWAGGGGGGGGEEGETVMAQELALDSHLMVWPNISREENPPKSVCSEECPTGHVKSFTVSDR